MTRALILAPFWPPALDRLRRRLEVDYQSWMDSRRLLSPEDLVTRIVDGGIGILVVEADYVFSEVFEQAPVLKFVGVCRGTVTNVDVEAATRCGVLVVNTPARNAIAVAELTIGLILSLARQIPAAHSLVRSGGWQDPVEAYFSLRGQELAGNTAGIIGLGAIGYEVARRLRAFDMSILACDPYASPERISSLGGQMVGLERLMAASDIISLHCPPLPETEGIINSERLALMKSTAFLVNTSAASLVDETALVQALRERRIAGAAVDVFPSHPVTPGHHLLGLDNVVLTPHIGGATEGTVRRHSLMMAEDIERFLQGQRPHNLVNPAAWRPGG